MDHSNNLRAHTGNYTSQSATRTFQAVKTTTINNVQFLQLKLLNMKTIDRIETWIPNKIGSKIDLSKI